MIFYIKLALFKFIEILQILLLIRCVISWLPVRNNILITYLYKFTDPILLPIQNVIYRNMYGGFGFDISPIIALFLLNLASRLINFLI